MLQNTQMLSQRIDSLLSADPTLKLRTIAHNIGVDRHEIERAVREHYGFTFRELKKRVRLKRAVALLADEQHSSYVKEIAAAVGLTPNALSRFIRFTTGHSATELRGHK